MLNVLKRMGLLLLAAMFLASCSKSSSSTGPSGTAPTLETPTFAGPSSTSSSADTSYGAVYAKSAAALFNSTASTFTAFYTGSASQSGNAWEWSYSAGGFTAHWSATSSGSGYDWKLVYNGAIQGESYNNWTALSGHESTDGKTGNWSIYYPNTSVIAYQVSWSTSSSGSLNGTIVMNDSSGTAEGKDVFTNNTDKSGELQVYTGSVMTLDVKWNADGSGTWIEYDDTGKEIGSGSWT